jgi:glycosyltransferase involved in cell wall biosynthesis
MRIGVDATALVRNRTGVGNYVYPLLRELCLTHPDARFFLYSNDSIVFDELDNVEHRVSRPKRRGPWWQCTHLRRMLKMDRPHVYWGSNGLLPFPEIRGMATVVTVHDLVYFFAGPSLPRISYWGRRIFQPLSVKGADRLIAVSRATAADIAKVQGRTPDCIIEPQLSPGFHRVSPEERQRVKKKLNLPDRFLLSLGTQEPRKNLAALFQAYLQHDSGGAPLPPLLVAGGGGWKHQAISRARMAGEATGRIRSLGFVAPDDLPALYALCDVFLMPSLYEGFGMPLREAQACGAPVIHGPHASMLEAAGGLGVVTGTGVADLRQTFSDLARGALALACRIPESSGHLTHAATTRLWCEFEAAMRLHTTIP